jgi:hypothetical protein
VLALILLALTALVAIVIFRLPELRDSPKDDIDDLGD